MRDENRRDLNMHEGDIIEMPLPDGRVALCWILHESHRFKDAVGFIVFGIKGQTAAGVLRDAESGRPLSMPVLGPLYTHKDAFAHYECVKVGHQPLTPSHRNLTKRIVGGGVYVGDDYIGSTEEVDVTGGKHQLIGGLPAIYKDIEKAYPISDRTA